MERKISGSNKNTKKIPAHIGSEFFALGTKGSRDDAKSKATSIKGTVVALDRKREATTTISHSVSKKAKVVSGRPLEAASGRLLNELWEQMATDCEFVELIDTIYAAADQNDNETVLRLLCGSIKHITAATSRTKFDIILYLSLAYIAKIRPTLFCNDIVTSALLYIIRRENNLKSRQSAQSHIIATNLLARAYNEKDEWPEVFIRVYIDDAINERIWADNELCAPFIENICSAFQTRTPPSNLLQLDTSSGTATHGQQYRDTIMNIDDDSGDNLILGVDSGASRLGQLVTGVKCLFTGRSRFSENAEMVEKCVTDAIKEQFNKRQQQDCYTRSFLKFLCSASGLEEVRYLCVSRLELWIHNGKLVKLAQQLLSYICFNIKSSFSKDHEVLAMLVKMRLKTKPLINFYMTCLKETIGSQPDILSIVLKLVVQNELSNTRNPNNMGMLATIFQTSADLSASYLAEIYKEFLLQREDCLRTLRVFLRELSRMLRFDINIVKFVKVFLSERLDINEQIENSEFRDRIFHSMVDITCLCMLLSVSPQVREANLSLRTNRDMKSNPVLIKFCTQMSQIQLDAVSWMFATVPKIFKIQGTDYSQALHKLLLLEAPEQYSRCDQWPSEPERATLLRMAAETPVHEDTLLRLIVIGITKDIPFSIPETIEIIMLVIKRASAMRIANCPAVQSNKFEIIDFLFSMAEYHHPENIKLPVDYDPPKLAITVLYWKAWLIMLMLSAHNPSTFGAFCWEHYPTMRMLMEMCITNQFNESAMEKNELQILPMEREYILEFETHLAAQTSQAHITEETAILISQLMLMDPIGLARRVPAVVLEQLKHLNKTLKLGHLLCRSRKPDLLLDIIQRQGTTQSMPWLSDLVQSSEGDFNHLPVQCLCEFLLFNANGINEENSRDAALVDFLRNLIMDSDSSKQTVCEVLDYIFRRLSSTVKQSRSAALTGLKIIFKCTNLDENDWLLTSMPQIPHFREVSVFIIPQLRSACQVENNPELVMAYIQFIAAHTLNDPVTDMLDHIIDMAQLIVERSTMFTHIIPSTEDAGSPAGEDVLQESRLQTLKCLFVMFNNYIIKLREHHEPYEWTEYPDLLMVQFDDGVQLPLHLNIIHAFIILLTHSNNTMPESAPILDYWFPPGRAAPTACLPNMPLENVQLLPDWLKLKMIRSPVDRLIEAALLELTPDQIVLFVQNFGTPVNSMSKLLALLDHAVIEQFDAVKNAILNKAYLAQLIEIQQARGAKNGHFTVQALGLHSHSQTVPDLPRFNVEIMNSTSLTSSPDRSPFTIKDSAIKIDKEVEELVHMVCTHADLNEAREHRLRRLIVKILQADDDGLFDNRKHISQKVLSQLVKLLERTRPVHFYQKLSLSTHLRTLLRALLQYNPVTLEDCNRLFQAINDTKQKLMNPEAQATNFKLTLIGILHSKRTEQKQCVSKLADVLFETTDSSLQTQSKDYLSREVLSRDGVLVDSLTKVDPEFIISNKKQKVTFLFSKECSYYFLSMICHQTNWQTLASTLNLMLKSRGDYDCSTVLNFVEALVNNPKLWQGCEQGLSKTSHAEGLLSFSDNELDAFTQYILKEVEAEMNSATSTKYDCKLGARIELLLRITNRSRSTLTKFTEYVLMNSASQNLRLKVFQQLYLMYPSVKFIRLKQASELNSAKLQSLRECPVDKISNYLITCLGNLVLKKDFESLSSDTELLMRKLAASHPALFLRQLGALACLIQGRAELTVRALRDEHHMHRFIQLLRTLELLQPMVFDDAYQLEFQSALDCYFSFFKHHSYAKETYHILIKFVSLLQAYINMNPKSALSFLEQYVNILMELAARFHSVVSLHQLVQGIALLQHKSMPATELNKDEGRQDFELDEHSDSKAAAAAAAAAAEADTIDAGPNLASELELSNRGEFSLAITGAHCKSMAVTPRFLNLISTIKHSNSEEAILGPLQEIESITSKQFSFLSELFDRLLELIFSPSAQIRSNAFILLIRHLKHNPGRSDINRCTLNAYIQCLRDNNSSVASTAVDNLPEIVLLLQEHAVAILVVAFSLGIRSRLNTCGQIKRVLQTLMLQHGY